MFCSIKKVPGKGEFKDKLEDIRYRIYICERKRVNGKVKSFDKLIYTFDYEDITHCRIKVIERALSRSMVEKFKIDNIDGEYAKVLEDTLFKIIDLKDDLEEKTRKKDAEFIKQQQERARKEREQYEEFYKSYNNNKKSSGMLTSNLDDTTREMITEIIKQGYKKVSHKFHPDKGGSTEDMQKLNSAKEYLDTLLG